MIFYLNGLVRGMVGGSSCAEEPIYIVPAAHATGGSELLSGPQSRLILAGYSYGSIIAYHLPNSNRVIHLFETCSEGSAEQEIQLKASHLSSQTLKDFQARQEYNDTRENVGDAHLECLQSSSPLVVGGFESAACEQRIDKESRRSLNVRRSLDRARGKVKSKTHRLLIKKDESDDDSALEKTSNLVMPQICYLLISPVLPPMASLLTLFSSLSFKGRERDKHSSSHDDSCELTKSPSLAVFGNKDVFTSAKKVRTWAEKLSQIPGSTFQHREIDGAGHFWRESGVLEHMKNDIKEWESSL